MIKDYDPYLFDLDGTLISTTELIVTCFEFSLKKHLGIDPSKEKIRNLIGLPLREQVAMFIEDPDYQIQHLKQEVDIQQLEKDHMEYQITIWSDWVTIFPGVKETIQTLFEMKKSLGVVTSRKFQTTNLFLEHFQLDQFFSVIITPEDTSSHKPNADPILEALKQMGKVGHHAVYVGDAKYDVLAAQAAGIDQILVEWEGENSRSNLDDLNPTHRIKSLIELLT